MKKLARMLKSLSANQTKRKRTGRQFLFFKTASRCLHTDPINPHNEVMTHIAYTYCLHIMPKHPANSKYPKKKTLIFWESRGGYKKSLMAIYHNKLSMDYSSP